MKILLAGATGVIGRPLLPLLINAGHDVAGTTRDPAKADLLRSEGARPVVVDVFDRSALFAILRAERPDAVIHLLTDLADGDFAANTRLKVTGTHNLVDAAQAAGVKRLVAENYCLYAPGPGLAREEDPLALGSAIYSGSIEGIQALENSVSQVAEGVVLRYGSLYGPGTWHARDGRIARQVRAGEFTTTPDIASFLHVEDAAQAALFALHWPPGRVNIVDDEPAPGTEWAPAFAAALGAPPPPVKTGGESSVRGVSNAKARKLGWQPLYRSWREGFRRALGGMTGRPGA